MDVQVTCSTSTATSVLYVNVGKVKVITTAGSVASSSVKTHERMEYLA